MENSFRKVRNALISVSNTEKIDSFARILQENSIEIIATRGTYKALQDARIKSKRLEEIVKYPEMIDGRVKTLQPEIFSGILARRIESHLSQLKEEAIDPIDMVVCNFYPFEKMVSRKDITHSELIENIDIGGPSLVRAASKNSDYVTVVPSPKFYDQVSMELMNNNGSTSLELRRSLAHAAFGIVSSYDIAIYAGLQRFTGLNQNFPERIFISAERFEDTRYGENPDQKASIYKVEGYRGMANWTQISGEKKSFNNYLDIGGAYEILEGFEAYPAAATVKHGHISGFAFGPNLAEAYKLAHSCDSEADFGGSVVLNREVDVDAARLIGKNSAVSDESIYTEIVIAPSYTSEALEILKSKQKKKMRLMIAQDSTDYPYNVKLLEGVLLVQDSVDYTNHLDRNSLSYPTKVKVDDTTLNKLLAAWEIVRKIESNGIVVADGKTSDGELTHFWTYGVASFRKRNGATKIALDNAGDRAKGAVVASDGFFPVKDSIDMLARAGVKAVIQPGGSIRDDTVIEAANQFGIGMVFTHTRAFKH